jgi:UDP-2,3-diacylglucosamine pyrophosphatase LpxH
MNKLTCYFRPFNGLDEYSVIDLYGTSTLLTHGDLLCTDDLPYQEFRVKSHSAEWQENVLSKPLILRLLYARWYRLQSFQVFFDRLDRRTKIIIPNPCIKQVAQNI